MWIHSISHDLWCDHVSPPDSGGNQNLWAIGSSDGRLVAGWVNFNPGPFASKAGFSVELEPDPGQRIPWLVCRTSTTFGVVGFYAESVIPSAAGGARDRLIALPDWFLIVLFLLPPLRWLKRPKASPGHCTACGYDLRATPNLCPECGTIPARAAPLSVFHRDEPEIT